MLLIKYPQALDPVYFTKFIKQMSEHAGFLNALFNVKPCRLPPVYVRFYSVMSMLCFLLCLYCHTLSHTDFWLIK